MDIQLIIMFYITMFNVYICLVDIQSIIEYGFMLMANSERGFRFSDTHSVWCTFSLSHSVQIQGVTGASLALSSQKAFTAFIVIIPLKSPGTFLTLLIFSSSSALRGKAEENRTNIGNTL